MFVMNENVMCVMNENAMYVCNDWKYDVSCDRSCDRNERKHDLWVTLMKAWCVGEMNESAICVWNGRKHGLSVNRTSVICMWNKWKRGLCLKWTKAWFICEIYIS